MNRKIAWLALPLVLFALMLGVKWRTEHPTPTKEDLSVRALMLQSNEAAIGGNRSDLKFVASRAISQAELKPFVDTLFVIRPNSQLKSYPTGVDVKATIRLSFKVPRKDDVTSVYANLSGRSIDCRAVIVHLRQASGVTKSGLKKAIGFTDYQLHPVTIKRWLQLLHANPRIGPRLFAH